ncbi:L-fuculose-phosphate aldolase [Cohnella caldifontis]|uniref:L-fuculose-phosphate aldolase n=1 Tax=Cohnella caldifontis TaxID=3027471 RepID=UPI0023EBDA0E|nr:L-fuculose-phosphate aldolase [Cohnella sp. YIM B05605]
MLLQQEREQIAEYGRKLIESGLTRGSGGNLSIYDPETNLAAISPSGMAYDKMMPEDVVVVDLEGKTVDGTRKPSSELDMHLVFYRGRADIRAVVHTHSPFASTVAALQIDLPAANYLVSLAGTNVRCSEYATFGTKELADSAFEGMRDRKAVLLANHGLLAGGSDLADAFNVAETMEFCAEVFCRAKSMGEPKIIPEEEMKKLVKKFVGYGR